MANRILKGTGTSASSINYNGWSIGLPGTGLGPTSATGYLNGLIIPEGGYAVYHDTQGANIVSNDDELVEVLRMLGATAQLGDKSEAVKWARANNVLVFNHVFENISANGLVLNLDAKHVLSYVENKPTTNVVTNTNLNTGWSKGYQSNIAYDTIAPPQGVNSQVVEFTKNSTSSYWYSYGDYAPQVPGQVYTTSIYVKTQDPNFEINFYTANNSETGRIWGSHISVPADGKWHRVVWPSFTNATNSQSDSLSFNMRMRGEANHESSKTWLCAPQLQPGTEATPFVVGVRSQNTEWVDLSGNNNHHNIVNNPTYSGYDFTLNETQGFNISNAVTKSTNSTVALWYKTTDNQELWVRGDTGSEYIAASYGNNYYHQSSGSPTYYADLNQVTNPSTQGIRDGRYHMVEAKNVNFSAWDSMNWFLYGSSWNMNGSVAKIMVYDRPITSQESSQNYYGGNIVTNGLTFATDAGNVVSYEPGSGTTYSLVDSKTGTLVNSPGYDASAGGAFTFNGSNQYIRIDAGSALGTGQITIGAWVYPTEDSTNGGRSRGSVFGGPGALYLGLWPNSSNGSSAIHTGVQTTSGRPTTQTGTIKTNEWSYLLATYDGVNFKTYLNGEYVTQTSQTGNISSGSTYYIGTYAGLTDNNHNFPGKITCATIYNRALSQEEILQNYNAHVARFK